MHLLIGQQDMQWLQDIHHNQNGVNVQFLDEDVTKPIIYIDCGSYAHLGAFSLSEKVIENLEAGAARQQQQTQQRQKKSKTK